ncbi:response regulator [Sphingomonas rhizophila]|uniref:response regulator n=1 Tax=Sphingomonas rhizophila TaxID=2071607 RepID=UPI001FE2CA28|nr:response regulator [Sphingomonas rhizophila]
MKGALATSRPAGTAARRPIRLMIVDDSMVARAVLSRMIVADGLFEIAAVAGTGEDAVEALGQVKVDIVLLDLEMPGAGGLKSIPRILEAARGARVLIVSSLAEEGLKRPLQRLRSARLTRFPSRVRAASTGAFPRSSSASSARLATPTLRSRWSRRRRLRGG